MAMSDEDILDVVRDHLAADRRFARELEQAVHARSDSWIKRLVRGILGVVIEIGKALISAITGWFLPPRLPW